MTNMVYICSDGQVTEIQQPISESEVVRRAELGGLPLNTQATHRFSSFAHRPELEEAWRIVYRYCAGGRRHHFLTLAGSPGKGKTHLALACAWTWLELGRGTVAYYQVETLLDALRRSFNKREKQSDDDAETTVNYVSRCSLAVLDDLGAEAVTEWAWSKLDSIVDYRYINKLPLIVTTNVALERLPPRIADRLMEGQVVILKGESYRRREQNESNLQTPR